MKLTQKESYIFAAMKAKAGVPYLEGKAGTGKTALIYSIAQKTNHKMVDIRLSSMDETDLGLYPVITERKGNIKTIDFAVPLWAYESNTEPTILFFDELNRAPLTNRNAALQIMQERQIGHFKFNNNVLMVAAGNAGEEDGNDVDEFDAALWGRLLYIKYNLTVDEWIDDFAKNNVWHVICDYIKSNPEQSYQLHENSKSYASFRSWTHLSKLLENEFGGLDKINIDKAMPLIKKVASWYVGESSLKFIRYLEDMKVVNVNDILNSFNKVETTLTGLNRSRKSDLLNSLKEKNINKLSKKQLKNIALFLHMVDPDERVAYLLHVFDSSENAKNTENESFLFNEFPHEYKIMTEPYKA